MALSKQLAVAVEKKQSLLTDALCSSLPLFGHAAAKRIQADAICELVCSRDVLVTVPTGYGKSHTIRTASALQ